MPEPQATATHEGLYITSLKFSFSRGVYPSACHVTAIPLPTFTGQSGPLVLKYGDETLTFPGCAVDYADLRMERGREINMRILDRRWKWRSPIVTYRANVPLDTENIRADTARTPAQIAQALFNAIGESGYDTSAMPANVYPYVEWEGVSAADALNELCRLCGCIVVLGTDNIVRIKRLGVGNDLPFGATSLNELYPTQSAVLPRNVEARAGDVVIQSKLRLQCVGQQTNGNLATIDNLTYKPSNGWEYESPRQFANVSTTYLDRDSQTQYASTIAYEGMWKLYRVQAQAHGGVDVPGIPDAISSIEQYTLLDTLNDFALDGNSINKPLPAYVEGTYWPESDNYENTPAGTRYHGKFTVDPVWGLVRFEKPVLKLSESYLHKAADLYLTTTYTVRRSMTSTDERYLVFRQVSDAGTGSYGVDRRDITPAIVQRYSNVSSLGNRLNNLTQVNQLLNNQIDVIQAACIPQPAQDARYGGWRFDLNPDGAIAQVTWTMDRTGVNTRVTRWFEHWPTPGGLHARS